MASAEQLLSQIHSESLQQLLLSLREESQPPIRTGIHTLDNCLSRDSSKCLRTGDVIHVQGPTGTGKTHLLYFLLASCVLPPKHLGHQIGGWDRIAFVLDMDRTFDAARLKDILVDRLRILGLLPPTTTGILERCLQRVHIFCPASTEQLAVTLAYLPKYYLKHFPDSTLGMIAIHSVDALYWLDRFKAETLDTSTSKVYQNVASMLQIIRERYGAVSIITHWGLPQNNKAMVPSNPQFEGIPRHLECLPITVQIFLSSTPTYDASESRSPEFQAAFRSDREGVRQTFSFTINKFGLSPK